MAGAIHARNRERCYFVQTNNPTEEMLRKQGLELTQELASAGAQLRPDALRLVQRFLESCGGSAAACAAHAVASTPLVTRCPGGYEPQADELVVDFLNDPRNYDELARTGGGDPRSVPGNRRGAFYPLALARVFGVRSRWLPGFDMARGAADPWLDRGCALMVCLRDPGHWITILEKDQDSLYRYSDSWPTRKPEWNGDGWWHALTSAERASVAYEAVAVGPV